MLSELVNIVDHNCENPHQVKLFTDEQMSTKIQVTHDKNHLLQDRYEPFQ